MLPDSPSPGEPVPPEPTATPADAPNQPLVYAADMVVRSYQWLTSQARFSPTEKQRLFGLTIIIGVVCGLVAVAFHESIRWVERYTIDQAHQVGSDAWIPWSIAVPTLGALIAGILLYYVPGARGSGIPQVKIAYASSNRRLRLRDSIGKFFIGSLQLGTGSSMGREGPTVQICSGVAQGLGRLGGVSLGNLKLLLPVGAAAGIAAAFNAPIAAVTFTIEEIVGKLDQTMLSGVIVAAAVAAVVERSVLGENPIFSIPQGYGLDHGSSLLVYAALGVAAALMAVAFTESLLKLRRRFNQARRIPLWLRPAFGGLATGILGVVALLTVHHGGITGGGYAGLSDALTGHLAVEVMLVLGAAKLVATVLSYASGGAGGIFAPSLFMGAMLGGAFGFLDMQLFSHGHEQVGSFALVGMGAVFAGVVRAPITSVLIIIEMTAGYGLTLPLMIANMVAYGLARQLRPLPIYDALLEQDGVHLHTETPTLDALDGLTIDQIKLDHEPYVSCTRGQPATSLLAMVEAAGRQTVFPVLDDEKRLVGIITLDDLAMLASEPEIEALVCASDIMKPATMLQHNAPAGRVIELMAVAGTRVLPVVDAERRIIGFVEEVTIAREFLRLRARERAAALASPK